MVQVTTFTEDAWEQLALEALAEHEWPMLPGRVIAPGSEARTTWDDPVIHSRLMAALTRLNPDVPTEYLRQAMTDILSPKSQDPITENFRFHRYLVDGYRGVSYLDSDGQERNPTIRLVGVQVEDNDYLAVNQVTVRSGEVERRFDVAL